MPKLKNGSAVQSSGEDAPFAGDGKDIENAPLEGADYKELADNGVKVLVSLHKPAGNVKDFCARYGIEWSYYPVADYGVPQNAGSFDTLVSKIIGHMDSDRPVCVHCYAGVGRTGLVLACIVGKYYAISAPAAVTVIWRTRAALETREQDRFVAEYLARYGDGSRPN